MPQPLDYHRLADSLLAALVVLALCVLASTFVASCAHKSQSEPWYLRDVPSKEDIGQ